MIGLSLKNWSLIAPVAIVMPAYAAEYLNEIQAQKILFPSATEFSKKTIKLTEAQISKIKDLAGVRQRTDQPLIWQVSQKQKPLGLLFVDEVIGKHEYITYAAAVSMDGHVIGVEIMSYRETHGGEIKQENWRSTFKGKTLKDPFKLDKDVPNITGATLSCRNVLEGVKRILVLQQVLNNDKIL